MPPTVSRSGQYLEYIGKFEVVVGGITMGELTTVSDKIDSSVLSYNEYIYTTIHKNIE